MKLICTSLRQAVEDLCLNRVRFEDIDTVYAARVFPTLPEWQPVFVTMELECWHGHPRARDYAAKLVQRGKIVAHDMHSLRCLTNQIYWVDETFRPVNLEDYVRPLAYQQLPLSIEG